MLGLSEMIKFYLLFTLLIPAIGSELNLAENITTETVFKSLIIAVMKKKNFSSILKLEENTKNSKITKSPQKTYNQSDVKIVQE